jgi:hypothetical protein
LKRFRDTCEQTSVGEESHALLPLANRCYWHISSKSSPLPAQPEKVSDGPEGRQDDVGREISSRDPVKGMWGTRFPPQNRPACNSLASSSSSARRRWHSLHSHRSPVRRRRDLRPEISSPCMRRTSCAALARRAALRDHHTMRQTNACSTRLPCLSQGCQGDPDCLDRNQLPPGTLDLGTIEEIRLGSGPAIIYVLGRYPKNNHIALGNLGPRWGG